MRFQIKLTNISVTKGWSDKEANTQIDRDFNSAATKSNTPLKIDKYDTYKKMCLRKMAHLSQRLFAKDCAELFLKENS